MKMNVYHYPRNLGDENKTREVLQFLRQRELGNPISYLSLTDCTSNHYWQKKICITGKIITDADHRDTDSDSTRALEAQRSTSTIWGSTSCIQLWWEKLFSSKRMNFPNIAGPATYVDTSAGRLHRIGFFIVITCKYKESVLISTGPPFLLFQLSWARSRKY